MTARRVRIRPCSRTTISSGGTSGSPIAYSMWERRTYLCMAARSLGCTEEDSTCGTACCSLVWVTGGGVQPCQSPTSVEGSGEEAAGEEAVATAWPWVPAAAAAARLREEVKGLRPLRKPRPLNSVRLAVPSFGDEMVAQSPDQPTGKRAPSAQHRARRQTNGAKRARLFPLFGAGQQLRIAVLWCNCRI